MILTALALLAANGCLLLAGLGVGRLAAPSLVSRSAGGLGLAYLAGVASVGVISPLLLMAGLALTVPEIVVLCGALFLAGFLRRGRVQAAGRDLPGDDRGVARAAAAITTAFLVLLAVDFAFQPLFRSDAWAQWAARARSLVLFDGIDLAFFTSATTVQNLDYPLLLPSLEAIDFRFMGFDTRVLHLQFWLLLAGFVAALLMLARGRVPVGIVWAFVVAIVLAPTVAIQAASAYADIPLAIFFALAGVCAWRWLVDGDRESLALLGLFAAAALATKVEGFVFAAALFLALVPLVARRSRRRAAATAVVGAASLIGILPWRAWTRAHDVPGIVFWQDAFSFGDLAADAGRVPTALGSVLREVFDPASWLLLVPLSLASLLLAARRGAGGDGAVFAGAAFLLSLGGIVWTYWASPLPLDFHLATSADRIISAPVLFLAALSPFLLAGALGGRRHSEPLEVVGPEPVPGGDGAGGVEAAGRLRPPGPASRG